MDGVIKRASPSQRKFTYSRAAARTSSKSSRIRSGHRSFRYSRSHLRTTGLGQECVKETRSISPGAIAVDCQSAGQLIPFWYTMFCPKYSPWMTVCGASSKIGTRDSKDRKSTRLNSSHLVISYAVFCLKKKIATQHSPAHSPPSAVEVPVRI